MFILWIRNLSNGAYLVVDNLFDIMIDKKDGQQIATKYLGPEEF